MTGLDKNKLEFYDFSDFTEEQIKFIRWLIYLSYNDGYEDGKNEITNKILETLSNK